MIVSKQKNNNEDHNYRNIDTSENIDPSCASIAESFRDIQEGTS